MVSRHLERQFSSAFLSVAKNVVAVCCAPTKEGKPDDPLAEFAREKGLPLHQPESWKTPEALELMKSFDADVCMMAYVLLFVPEAVRDAPKYGTFQYHPSLCPAHRGPSSINWPIAMGKTRTGLSIFWPNDGLDEGPMMLQKTCDIGPDETLGDVYFNKLFPMGVDAMIEGLELVKAGVIIKHDQRLEDGSYESWFGKAAAELDWSKPVADVYNTIGPPIRSRGLDNAEWRRNKIYDSARLDGDGMPGEVVELSDSGVIVQGNGGRILIKRVRPAGSGKIAANEWARAANINSGTKLGS